MSEQLKDGKTRTEMGWLKFEGFKEACWDPLKFTAWLVENKLEEEAQYDYEFAKQKKIRMGVINLQQHQKRRKQNE